MAIKLGTYEACFDMGRGGEVYVRRASVGWVVDHMSYHGDHGSLIGPTFYTWHEAVMAALAYAVEGRRPMP